MNPNRILLLQALLIFLQGVNTAMAAHVPQVASEIGFAFVGSLQFLVQHVGNQALPQISK